MAPRSTRRGALVATAVLFAPATTAIAQIGGANVEEPDFVPPPAFAEPLDYTLDSGVWINTGDTVEMLSREIIDVLGAPSLRVFFSEIDLGPSDYLDVVGLADGAVHHLTSREAAKWDESSAYFNGDQLELRLYVAPGSRASYTTGHLLVGLDGVDMSGGEKTICGAFDDRLPTDDNRVSRFLNSSGTSACTGWLAGIDDCAFSAGHCFPTFASTGEFNVPLSLASGAFQHPAPEHQFPIDQGSLIWNNTGIGSDYALCHLLTNQFGESAAAKYGFFELGFFKPNVDDPIRISGFGSDSGTSNQILQTHSGPAVASTGTSLRYVTDTTGGNSGSPVIDDLSGRAIGIHTNGGCGSGGGSNSGTSLTNSGLTEIWEDNCAQGPPAIPVADFLVSADTVTVGQLVIFDDESTGVPNSWSWDFNEDGAIDSTDRNPTYSYAIAGVYDVTLTVSNALGTDSFTLVDAITVNPISPTTVPYTQDFQSGLPVTGEWVYTSDVENGSIFSGSDGTGSPISGSPSLAMASSIDNVYATNEAKLFIDASASSGLEISYWFKQTGDEPDAEDGLFISDGVNEALAQSHQNGPASWAEFNVDLGAVAAANGVALNENFHLIFRQRDNYGLGTDGHLIDDVEVVESGFLSGDIASVGVFLGGTQTLTLEPGANFAGDSFWVFGSASGSLPGTPIPGGTLPLNTPDPYFTETLINPNQSPLSNSLGTLDGAGNATTLFVIPPATSLAFIGLMIEHAAIAFDPTTFDVTAISNAVSVELIF